MLAHWVKNGTPIGAEVLEDVISTSKGCTIIGGIDYKTKPTSDDGPVGDLVFITVFGGLCEVRMVVATDGTWMAKAVE